MKGASNFGGPKLLFSQKMLQNIRKVMELPSPVLRAKLMALAKGNVYGRLYVDENHDINQSLLIAGTHRSGSTWLANVLNHSLHYRFVFEPIRHTHRQKLKPFQRRYLRPGQIEPYFKQYFEDLLTGEESTYHLNRKNGTFHCYGRMLKDTSINLLMKWLRLEFPSLPMVYIIRNPFLVVNSCLKLDWLKPQRADFWLKQEDLVEDYLQPYMNLISEVRTNAEKYMLEWCISNFVPLQQFRADEWQLVFYDDLLREPMKELDNIFSYLDKSCEESTVEKMSMASHTAEEDVQNPQVILAKWRSSLSLKDQKMIEQYAYAFGLEQYLGLSA